MPREAIKSEERSKYEYALCIEDGPEGEIRRLFARDEKEEVKRWERVRAPDGSLRQENEFRKGEIFSQKDYFPGGLPRGEILYRQGKEDLRIRFEYAEGKPARLSYERPEEVGGDL